MDRKADKYNTTMDFSSGKLNATIHLIPTDIFIKDLY